MAKKKGRMVYRYECTITGDSYKMTKAAPNPDELMSVKAYYELNPDKDDRPDYIKKEAEVRYEKFKAREAELAALAAQYNNNNNGSNS